MSGQTSKAVRDHVEQRIALGWSHARIAVETKLPIARVDRIRWAMLDDHEDTE